MVKKKQEKQEDLEIKDSFTKEEIVKAIQNNSPGTNSSSTESETEFEDISTTVVRFYFDKRIFLNKDITSIVSENFISFDLSLPTECFNMIVASAPECDPIERQLIDAISQQYWLENNNLLETPFNDGIEE